MSSFAYPEHGNTWSLSPANLLSNIQMLILTTSRYISDLYTVCREMMKIIPKVGELNFKNSILTHQCSLSRADTQRKDASEILSMAISNKRGALSVNNFIIDIRPPISF